MDDVAYCMQRQSKRSILLGLAVVHVEYYLLAAMIRFAYFTVQHAILGPLAAEGQLAAFVSTLIRKATVNFNSSVCVVTMCHGSHFMGRDGRCKSCPTGSVSSVGSWSINACLACGDGLVPNQPTATECAISNDSDTSITTNYWVAHLDTVPSYKRRVAVGYRRDSFLFFS
jgi:hypothetical protein